MATAQGTTLGAKTTAQGTGQEDRAESMLRSIDGTTKGSIGVSLFHVLTIGSIGASIALFLSGRKEAGIFVGLWPPTFQALKAATENRDKAA